MIRAAILKIVKRIVLVPFARAYDPHSLKRHSVVEFMSGEPKVPSADNPITLFIRCTCRGNERSLGEKILEYCKNGLHKGSVINNALP